MMAKTGDIKNVSRFVLAVSWYACGVGCMTSRVPQPEVLVFLGFWI
jgi:hypothetical protein